MISLGAREEDIFSKPTAGKSQWLIRWGLFLLALLPVLIVSSVSYKTQKETLTHEVFSRRQEIAHLSAMLVKERFDRLVDIGVSFATRNRLSEYLEQNQWQEAIQMVRHLPEKMPFIERIFLTDPAGTEMADLPELEGAVGKNFAHRDWFLGVTRSHKPYVSEIYQRAAAPQHNVVAVAIPILSEESAVLGILVMQLKLDVFYDWARSISVGPGGHIFFMDPKGHVAAHPQFPAQGPIVDFSKVPAIRRVLSRQRGLEII